MAQFRQAFSELMPDDTKFSLGKCVHNLRACTFKGLYLDSLKKSLSYAKDYCINWQA